MKVLVIGATGFLGSQIAAEVAAAGHQLFALLRGERDYSAELERMGATVLKGDLTDQPSLQRALNGMDAVISSAIGYTGRQIGDSLLSVDDQGNRNLALAAKEVNTKRLVFISVLKADTATSVEHFHQKYVIEQYLAELQLPFVALRPGAFLDQNLNRSASAIADGSLPTIFASGAKLSFVLSSDVARAAAQALELPDVVGRRIDLGLASSVTMEQMAQALSKELETNIRVAPQAAAPQGMQPFVDFVNAGRYIADVTDHKRFFDPPKSLTAAVASWLAGQRSVRGSV